MFRLTPLKPDLDMWRKGHLELAADKQQRCYFWTRESKLITRENIQDFAIQMIPHPGYGEPPESGMHLYRVVAEEGCVEHSPVDILSVAMGKYSERTPSPLYWTVEKRVFIRPADRLPIEVTYIGTWP